MVFIKKVNNLNKLVKTSNILNTNFTVLSSSCEQLLLFIWIYVNKKH